MKPVRGAGEVLGYGSNCIDLNRRAGSCPDDAGTLPGELFQGLQITLEYIGGLVFDEFEAGASVNTDTRAVGGRAVHPRRVLGAASRTRHHPLIGLF